MGGIHYLPDGGRREETQEGQEAAPERAHGRDARHRREARLRPDPAVEFRGGLAQLGGDEALSRRRGHGRRPDPAGSSDRCGEHDRLGGRLRDRGNRHLARLDHGGQGPDRERGPAPQSGHRPGEDGRERQGGVPSAGLGGQRAFPGCAPGTPRQREGRYHVRGGGSRRNRRHDDQGGLRSAARRRPGGRPAHQSRPDPAMDRRSLGAGVRDDHPADRAGIEERTPRREADRRYSGGHAIHPGRGRRDRRRAADSGDLARERPPAPVATASRGRPRQGLLVSRDLPDQRQEVPSARRRRPPGRPAHAEGPICVRSRPAGLRAAGQHRRHPAA